MIKKTVIASILMLTTAYGETLTVAGPSAGATHPIFNMIDREALKDINLTIKFKKWKNPDELKALILNQKVDFIASPITAGAILYNRGAKVQLTHLLMGGARGIVSSDKNIKNIKDLKGKTIGIGSRGGLADSLLRTLIEKNGLDYQKDIKIVYTQSSKNSTMMLLKGRIDCAMLSEPRISMALKKAKSLPSDKAPHRLFFNINIVEAWKKTFDTNESFAQVGFLAVGESINRPKLIKRFVEEYRKSLKWYIENPEKSAKLTAKYLKGLHPKAIKNGIKNSSYNLLDTETNGKKVKKLLQTLVESNPKSMGGKLPDNGFFFGN